MRDKECRGLSLIVTATSMAWLCSYRPRTRSANRALRRASGRPARFQRHTNHVLSKAIVTDAERGRSLIALEDLRGMRARVQVKGHQQARMANWGFHELRSLVAYKAALAGVAVAFVDPRNTSRGCSCCGLIDQRNRPGRDKFQCIGCGVAAPADQTRLAISDNGTCVPEAL